MYLGPKKTFNLLSKYVSKLSPLPHSYSGYVCSEELLVVE